MNRYSIMLELYKNLLMSLNKDIKKCFSYVFYLDTDNHFSYLLINKHIKIKTTETNDYIINHFNEYIKTHNKILNHKRIKKTMSIF